MAFVTTNLAGAVDLETFFRQPWLHRQIHRVPHTVTVDVIIRIVTVNVLTVAVHLPTAATRDVMFATLLAHFA